MQLVGSGGYVWPAGQHGICGDPITDPTPRKHEAGGEYWTGKPAATYQQGGIIKLTTVLTAFHKGRFGFRICKISGTSAADETSQLTDACFNQNVLVQANVAGAQAPGDAYLHLGSVNNGTYTTYYQLPSGLTCDGVTSRCVLQWYYLTGNSCNPPNEPAQYASAGLNTCGDNSPYPEEFWNCADVLITASGTSPSPVSPSPSSSPSPVPSPVPSPSPTSPSPSPVPSTSPSPSPKSPSPSPSPLPSPSPKSPSPSPSPSPKASPSPSPTAPMSPSAFCAAKGAYGFFADKAAACTAFYRCEATGSWYFLCPSTTKFNDAISACDNPANVVC